MLRFTGIKITYRWDIGSSKSIYVFCLFSWRFGINGLIIGRICKANIRQLMHQLTQLQSRDCSSIELDYILRSPRLHIPFCDVQN
ncbi:hypothetical protein BJ508DRAFT_100919 [Ascobolus immersus RN42]|uniref:Uncharacterized protein n=1 Tax=Ascobolus immersus RN42 TaxID=1160509 RepID=A0A3N4IKE0_ASCIM|nr:hypothetical protein BJ508DRAFT_100919 [Ascobolus immersus RN42]